MENMKPLDQVCPTNAYALNRTSKIQNKSVIRGSILSGLMNFASSVPDFRRLNKGNIRHHLDDILLLMILGRASGHVRRSEIIEFGRYNLNKLRKIGLLKNGVPSESTLCRVENRINELDMADKMHEFAKTYHMELRKSVGRRDIICIDGKAMCGTIQENGRNPDIVSAYSSTMNMTLATEACQEKSNEITAVSKLLDQLDIAGQIITADAMSMQKNIIDKIRQKGADFVIELKANQRSLRYCIEDKVKDHRPSHVITCAPALEHGRIETRTYRIHDGLDLIADKQKWGGQLTVVEFLSDSVIIILR